MRSIVFVWLVVAGLAGEARARIHVTSLPGRDSAQLTIYNSVDLTLVTERRTLTFAKGLNRLEFSWANTLIDPTSVEFKARTHSDEIEVIDVSFPPRVPNVLEWRIQSEFSGEAVVEIRYFTSGISWSADYVAQAAPRENTMTLAGYVRITNQSGEDYDNAQVRWRGTSGGVASRFSWRNNHARATLPTPMALRARNRRRDQSPAP